MRKKRRTTIFRGRISPQRIWQAILFVIFLTGFYLCLPPAEIAIARV